MGKLNAPREVPYDFRVFSNDGIIWLFDDSTRTFICSATPNIWAEPIYWVDGECDEVLPDPDYFGEWVEVGAVPVAVYTAAVTEKEAWDDAREDACGNCRI